MSAKPVQISLDAELLRRIDRDEEARKHGRSAFVRSALLLYLEAKRKKRLDDQIRKAFAGKANVIASEIGDLIAGQAWPRS